MDIFITLLRNHKDKLSKEKAELEMMLRILDKKIATIKELSDVLVTYGLSFNMDVYPLVSNYIKSFED